MAAIRRPSMIFRFRGGVDGVGGAEWFSRPNATSFRNAIAHPAF